MRQDRSRKSSSDKKLALWIGTVIVSILLIIVGHAAASKGLNIFDHPESDVRAKVTELVRLVNEVHEDAGYSSETLYFNAKILRGAHKGETVLVYQQQDNYMDTGERFVKVGDTILIAEDEINEEAKWTFGSYMRFDYMIVLGIVFILLLILFGRGKGISTVVSLALTCLAVFCVFLPAILSGANVYLMTVLICVFTIVMTLLLTNGATAKSFNTMLGCGSGVLMAALLTVLFDKLMHLTGVIDEHSIYLQVMNDQGSSIDLNGLIFAMITIGAMGAVMDVAMDIASSLYEVHRHAPDISFTELFKSGMNIGRDVMGTMANTLVLAYIGSNLCAILLRVSYASSLTMLLNTESITVEVLQALIGSMGILLTIPLTTLVCCTRYTGRKMA
ncbi:MAG: YibE/F family protein [Firmicutes bacterium]|nr:YibE/F family protein [Bacillota bacterium]